MGFKLATGVKYAIGTTMGSPIVVSSISNADPAIITAPGHNLEDKAPFMLNSGWEEISDSVFRASNTALGTIELENLDTTDTILFPTGSGGGNLTPITGWTDIPNITEVANSGGDISYVDVKLLALRYGIRIPDSVNPGSTEFTIAADRKHPSWSKMERVSQARKPIAIRKTNPDGETAFAWGYFFLNSIENVQSGQVQTVKASIATMRPWRAYVADAA